MDYTSYLQTVLALGLVVALILGAAWMARRAGFGSGGGRAPGRRRRRLTQVESLALDGKRRLVLVACDGREHLLLVGGGADLVIERNMVPAGPVEEPTA
jgi:flagellar protein FliO/FliZ